MKEYERLKAEIQIAEEDGKVVEAIEIAEDVQETIITELHISGAGSRITMLYTYPVVTTERGSGVKIIYH